MEARPTSRPPRTQLVLDTIAFGSLLVFASVTPPRLLISSTDAASPSAPEAALDNVPGRVSDPRGTAPA